MTQSISKVILLCVACIISASNIYPSSIPTFSKNTQEKKQQFFEFLLPMANDANNEIIKIREQIKSLQQQTNISERQKTWLENTAEEYKIANWDIKNKQSWDDLVNKVDIIPPSLLLAQAANESAWGASRFAKQGNNLFGQWCFTKGCGIVPSKRNKGSTHEVRAFSTVAESVKAYIHNLNTNTNYKLLRELRTKSRDNNNKIHSLELVKGLIKYSERGKEYIKEISQMISFNKLVKYDA